MELPIATRFVDRSSEKGVRGLVRIATDQDLLSWTLWRYKPTDEDRAWDWRSIFRECKASHGRYECYAALALDDLQGLTLLDLKPKKTKIGKAITVDYLATNPANRDRRQGLKYVGVALMVAAVTRSMESGAGGGLWLESLPGAAGFYDGLGMFRQARKSAEGNLIYLLGPGMAEQLLEEIKSKGIVAL